MNNGEVTIEWDGDYENPDDQVTIEELKEEYWVCSGQTLHEGSLEDLFDFVVVGCW